MGATTAGMRPTHGRLRFVGLVDCVEALSATFQRRQLQWDDEDLPKSNKRHCEIGSFQINSPKHVDTKRCPCFWSVYMYFPGHFSVAPDGEL
jgi:hypothetical protein